MESLPRSGGIDTLRGVACLLLVLYHVVGSNAQLGLRIESGLLRELNDALVCLRMPLFALLAGLSYGLGRTRTMPMGSFAKHQGWRLLIPMLTVGTLFALLQAATPTVNSLDRNWAVLHLEPVGHFWFLEALFWVLLVLHGLDRFGALARPSSLVLCWVAAALLSLAWRGPRWLGIEGALYLLPYAVAGVAMSHSTLAGHLSQRAAVATLILLAIPCVVLLLPLQPDPDRRQPTMLLAGTSLCLLLLAWHPQQALLARLGRHAYAVFLFHPFFTAAARIGIEPLGGMPTALLVLIGWAAGVVGPLLFGWGIRRHRWAARVLLGEPIRLASAHDPSKGRWRTGLG